LTEEAISSVAEATDCTLVEASSDAAATAVVNSCARTAVEVSVPAEASSSVDADDTVSMISPTALLLGAAMDLCIAEHQMLHGASLPVEVYRTVANFAFLAERKALAEIAQFAAVAFRAVW